MAVRDIPHHTLHLASLLAKTRRAFLYCCKSKIFAEGGWYLAGGTALALHVGHRKSLDLDFFTPRRTFDNDALERDLLVTRSWESSLKRRGTLYGELLGAKMSFIAYPFFRPSGKMLQCGMVRILPPEEIASMKIIAISQRGRKRDFLDLYWYCTHRESLRTVIERAIKQYPGQEHNLPHILKSLVYFADADPDTMPELFFRTTWHQVKQYFTREVPRVARQVL